MRATDKFWREHYAGKREHYWAVPLRWRRRRVALYSRQALAITRYCLGGWGPDGWVARRGARWRWAVRLMRREMPF